MREKSNVPNITCEIKAYETTTYKQRKDKQNTKSGTRI